MLTCFRIRGIFWGISGLRRKPNETATPASEGGKGGRSFVVQLSLDTQSYGVAPVAGERAPVQKARRGRGRSVGVALARDSCPSRSKPARTAAPRGLADHPKASLRVSRHAEPARGFLVLGLIFEHPLLSQIIKLSHV